ncbi:FAD-binding and (Fe-S)-binding domain-containing protein [Bythopirellula goksoeyrii]|uniref:Anaerobic glycerol-3-phosphate dehydrogenase subunit C n=1 Tax=Bythopirellula goksoeyrii TaxID=1400387 RepID=A0A5B9QTM5_9BACT|nr:FAD-binding and (Fe-S)-binding domain-containing protein [Bythopirellula goksoeyrii]QEG37273.1 Anaerobic glycerol-3-phosphate dehydrogenase subunit C [Bythopirellula goksoeyrii]
MNLFHEKRANMSVATAEPKPALKPLPEKVQEYLAELGKRTGGDIRSDSFSRVLYSTDASIYQVMPLAVVFPRDVEELQAGVELAAKHGVPILPRAGGSSLAGQAVNEAVVFDLTRHMNRILEVNTDEKWVRVEPGRVLDPLNIELRTHGLQFGPDPASSNRAAMGGIVGNNCTGSHSIVYGMAADHVLETGVFLSDGSRAHFGPLENGSLTAKTQLSGLEGRIYRELAALVESPKNREVIRENTPNHWRRCGGYNLDRLVPGAASYRRPQDPRFNVAKLLCGSEGSLGVMHEIKVNLVDVPKMATIAVIHFDELYAALSAVPTILETDPTAVELLDQMAIKMCRQVREFAGPLCNFVEGTPNCVLMTEFTGTSEAELTDKVARLRQHLKSQGVPATAVTEAKTLALQADVWTVRKAGLGLLMSMKGDYKPLPFIEDSAVPVEHLADYVTKIEEFCQGLGSQVAYYAHASAGCLHIRPLLNVKQAAEVAKLPTISDFSVKLLKGYGGALSSEHGDGRSRSWQAEKFYGPELYGLYRRVKEIFDPNNLLNPGNIVEAPPMTEHLRYGADYHVHEEPEHVDFSEDQGFHRAIEMCNGAGICRKTTGGTMCPSFMVTQDEEHSTRGRANLLRAGLSGLLPAESLTSERMYEALDLCIECKACKSECPSSVDMAKIKFEFLARYYEKNGVPFRARMMAGVPRASRLSAGLMAPLVNGLISNGLVRKLMDKLFGISQHRVLPHFASVPFTTWFRERPSKKATGKKVVLFNDTWNTYNHPEVSIAATEVLEAAGYDVLLPGHFCCGRPMISKGMVNQARSAARDCVEKLAPFAEQGIPIVGLEPSCLLTLRDEVFELLPDDPRTEKIAEHSVLFEEFIAKLVSEESLDLNIQQSLGKVLLHGHCHQKALVGTGPSKQTLAFAGGEVEEVDSGCCGMAGSFGYEAEHYDVSQAMGERRLLPAVRAAEDSTTIVAAGMSCRHQIMHGTGRRVLHPAEAVHRALFPDR